MGRPGKIQGTALNGPLKRGRKEGLLFLKKKKQKNFCSPVGRRWTVSGQAATGAIVFWFFFSKKNCFLQFVLAVLTGAGAAI
jgi:hypothetical protein